MENTTALLEFWEEQMKQSHTSSNYFFRKSPSHYHMMLLIMAHYKLNKDISVEELKTKLFRTIIHFFHDKHCCTSKGTGLYVHSCQV